MRIGIVVAALLWAAPARAAEKDYAQKAFERMSSLLGYWEAKDPEGKTVQVWYKLISGGTTLHETFKFDEKPEMVTMYHLDGKNLLATHYCSANNQPRMQAVPSDDPKEIRFDFRDITNLSAPEAAHMRSLKLRLEDADHFEQYWTYREKAKEQTLPLRFERKKTASVPAPAPAEKPAAKTY